VAGRDTQIRIRACNRRNECTDFSPERLNLRSLCY
jgi:hypothetical protein